MDSLDEAVSDLDLAVIEAMGRTNEGLGKAIEGLSKIGLKADAQELSSRLLLNARSISWAFKHVADRHFPSINK